MHKFTLFLFFVFVGSIATNAQVDRFNTFWDTKAHDKGQVHFSYGYGFPRLDDNLFKFHDNKNEFRVVGVGPFIFKGEYGVNRQLSVGFSAAYIKYTSDWSELRPDPNNNRPLWYKFGTNLTDLSVMLRLNYHWITTPRSDFYMGGGIGYNRWQSEDFTTRTSEDSTFNSLFKEPGGLAAEITLGYRYYFRQRNALYIEAGYGKSIIQGGFVFKFRHRKRE